MVWERLEKVAVLAKRILPERVSKTERFLRLMVTTHEWDLALTDIELRKDIVAIISFPAQTAGFSRSVQELADEILKRLRSSGSVDAQ